MPWYRRQPKIEVPLTLEDFKEGMRQGYFVDPVKHPGFVALLYYSAVRKGEALKAKREQFELKDGYIFFSVGKRLKHSKETGPLKIPLKAPYADTIWKAVERTRKGEKVFPFCSRSAYNIVSRAFLYPHLFRLSRITNFFKEGWTIAEVKSWTGLTLNALDYYVGIVSVDKMGESLGQS